MATVQEAKFKVIGTRPIRHDGVDKVTGRAKYGADISLPGLLHGKVLRSPHAHAKIKSIDVSAAEKLPGVKAVLTSADFPKLQSGVVPMGELAMNPHYMSMNLLAHDKVLYDGHPVAAVAATSPHIAEEAIRLIKVDYEVLPHVLDAEAAMKEDAPILLPELRTSGTPEKSDKQTNVASQVRFARGDLEAGFKAADVIVEREFNTAMVHQGYIEPHNAVAQYNPCIWPST